MKALLLAGGSGSRLWPFSRHCLPKQFLKLNSEKSLLCQAVERLLELVPPKEIVVLANSDFRYQTMGELSPYGLSHIVFEPEVRNTGPAIALGMKYCLEEMGASEDEVVFVTPSDHVVHPVDVLVESVLSAAEAARDGYIVTFGVRPTRAETGYGYIKVGPPLYRGGRLFHVEGFIEKPDLRAAQGYIKDGGYCWNSGMFLFNISSMMGELARYEPEIARGMALSYSEMLRDFGALPSISIDYAVMERSRKVVTLILELHWSDVGSWDSLYELLEGDEHGNIVQGDVLAVDTVNSIVIGRDRLVSTVGLEDCIVVETEDAVLVSKRGHTQKVRDVVKRLSSLGRREASVHLTVQKPWGSYTVLQENSGYKVKRISVNPGECLSLQRHSYRSEHWVVVKGTAKVTLNSRKMLLQEDESVFIPRNALHRLENPGMGPLEVIEIQVGDYLGEDDIVRVEDRYGR